MSPEVATTTQTHPAVPAGVPVFTVSQVNDAVKGVVEQVFPEVWVAGEASGVSRPNSGHVYLTLKDERTQIRSVAYRGVAMRLRFDLRDGVELVARGRLGVYAPRGEYQFLIEEAHPRGVGAAEAGLRRLKERLLTMGYFAPGRKRPLPRFPGRIGLITSGTGAAVRDILETLNRRWPAAEVVVRPTRVQGDGAAPDIAAAVRLLSALHERGAMPFDVVILGRGGGSVEDLWPFNEEIVARAIFESAVPVVSAVGHETDVTVADLVADSRALTPTAAAQSVTPDRGELIDQLAAALDRLHAGVRRKLTQARGRVDELAGRRALRLPLERLRELERRLDEVGERLTRSARQSLGRQRERLAGLAARLESLSPLGVLARGFSVTRHADTGRVVRSASAVRPGEVLRVTLAEGELRARVEPEDLP